MSQVIFKSTASPWLSATKQKSIKAALTTATTIHKRAIMFAPRLTGGLVSSGRVEMVGEGKFRVVFGGGRVPYAKRRHYENFKNPQTLLYLDRAGESVKRTDKGKFFK